MEEAATHWGGDDLILALIKSKKKASHAGPLGQLKSIEPDLLRAMADMKAELGIVRNAWMKSGFEWVR